MSRPSEDWGEEGLSAAERLYAVKPLKCWRYRREYREAGQRDSRTGASRAAATLRCGHQIRKRLQMLIRKRLAGWRVSNGRGKRDAKLCRFANRLRQPLDRLGGAVDLRQPLKSARGLAEFRRPRFPITFFQRGWACPPSGRRNLTRLLPSTRRTNTFCSRSPRRRLGIMAGLLGI